MTKASDLIDFLTEDIDDSNINFLDLLKGCVIEISQKCESDIFIFNAPIDNLSIDNLITKLSFKKDRKPNLILIFTTSGGNPHAAYRLTRYIQRLYQKFTLYLFGYCKSAGTLVAIGSDEIVMGDFAELGPLDMQLVKDDDLIGRSSGLDIQESIRQINLHVYEIFENCFFSTVSSSSGAITTKTAADIASSIAVGVLAPISSQVDPIRLGEVARSVRVAEDYGRRLNPSRESVVRALVSNYPSHSFVIDYDEARKLFGESVRHPETKERLLGNILLSHLRHPNDSQPLVFDLLEYVTECEDRVINGEDDNDHTQVQSSDVNDQSELPHDSDLNNLMNVSNGFGKGESNEQKLFS